MDNGANISENDVKRLLKDSEGESIDTLIKSRLTPDQQQTVRSVLSQPDKLKELLSTPFAKRFMEKLSRDDT